MEGILFWEDRLNGILFWEDRNVFCEDRLLNGRYFILGR